MGPSLRMRVLLAWALLSAAAARAQGFDTVAVIMGIEQRMNVVDQLPLKGVYLSYAGEEQARYLRPGEAVSGEPTERNELYMNPDSSIAAVVTYLRSTYPGVAESACHYFAEDGHTVAASWTLKWLGSQCTDSIAVETRYVYFHPIGETVMEYGMMQDQRGRRLDHTQCLFPNIERHFDAYYHRDMLMLSKHLPTK